MNGSSWENVALSRHKNMACPALLGTDLPDLQPFVALERFICQGL